MTRLERRAVELGSLAAALASFPPVEPRLADIPPTPRAVTLWRMVRARVERAAVRLWRSLARLERRPATLHP
jgi:hypothetical protein